MASTGQPRQATSANNLGFVLHAQGRTREALPYYAEALSLRDATLGPSVKAEIFRVLGKKYRFDPTDERALGMWDFIEGEKENLKDLTHP